MRILLAAIVVILLCGGLLPEESPKPAPPPQIEIEFIGGDITVCKYNPWTNTEVCSTFPD